MQSAGLERYFRELWEGKRRSGADGLLLSLLIPLSLFYALVLRLRAALYRTGVLPSYSLGKTVISVGNLSVGGTGKTPTAILLARMLLARGKRVALLSRGFGGPDDSRVRVVSDGRSLLLLPPEAADEPVLIARSVPGLVVVTGRDRYRAGLHARETFDPDVFILDDGYQHLRLRRDLNILLLDARNPFGNGHTLPAGLLREPESAVRRADLVILTRAGASRDDSPVPGVPCCRTIHRLAGIAPLKGGDSFPFSLLAGKKGIAFAGIGDPSSFFEALRGEGLTIVSTLAFRDHCRYRGGEPERLLGELQRTGADYLVTTEKDAVKLAAHGGFHVECYAALLEIDILDPDVLEKAIEKLL